MTFLRLSAVDGDNKRRTYSGQVLLNKYIESCKFTFLPFAADVSIVRISGNKAGPSCNELFCNLQSLSRDNKTIG